MKHLLSIFIVALFILMGCEKIDEPSRPKTVKEELKGKAEEVATAMSNKAKRERDEFVREAEVEIKELSIQIEEFSQRVEKEGGEVKEKMNKKLSDLQERLNEVRQEVIQIRSETSEKWHELQAKITGAVDGLKQSIANIKSNDA